jgi:Rieske Fe-S protein
LLLVGIGLSALAGAFASVPLVGYLLSPLRTAGRRDWVRLGALGTFPVGETRLTSFTNPNQAASDGPTAMVPCYVRRVTSDRVQVFAVNCAHLGCPVRWFPESGLFMCPCHGGVYYDDGRRASGPPPRGLFEYQWEIRRDELWVHGGVLPTLATPA